MNSILLPENGDTLTLIKPKPIDSGTWKIELNLKNEYNSSEITIADSIKAIIVGISFKDTIQIINNDTIVNIQDAKEKGAFSINVFWALKNLKGNIYWANNRQDLGSSGCNLNIMDFSFNKKAEEFKQIAIKTH